jgi:hypothetical protein
MRSILTARPDIRRITRGDGTIILVADTPATNIRAVRGRSRHRPAVGEIFVLGHPDGTFLFGRVIIADAPKGEAPMPSSHLIYVYDLVESDKTAPPEESLHPGRLLMPPLFINTLPWTRGYFEAVDLRPLSAEALLPQHCFWDSARRMYRDERGQQLGEEIRPCGVWGLNSYRTFDDDLSDALGLDRVPE